MLLIVGIMQLLVGIMLLIVGISLHSCKGPPGVAWTEDWDASFAPIVSSAEQPPEFAARCAPCHGTNGRGDGVAAAALNPRPRNFHDHAWQASVTDAQIERTILHGGESVGKSPLMPANEDLNPSRIQALRVYIRSLDNQ